MADRAAREVSFMRLVMELCARTCSALRSYGNWGRLVQRFAVVAAAAVTIWTPATASDRPIKIVALGDSLTAGYQIAASAAFPAQLEKVLRAKGLNVEIANAGVSGDTASG